MREFSTPLATSAPTTGNLTDDVVRNARESPDAVVMTRPGPDGWYDVTARTFAADVAAVAKGLVAAGIGAGDRVALMSRTRYEWTLLDYAIWHAGAVTVPIYETASAEQVAVILGDSGAVAVLTETHEHVARITAGRADLDRLYHVWTIDDDAIRVLTRLGAEVSDDELEARRTARGPADLATLIYTSGTTGPPRGCMLTHGHFMVELDTVLGELAELFDDDDATTLLFLPLAHVLARLIQVGCVRARVRMGHWSQVATLGDQLCEVDPTFVLAVPRVFEKMFNTASQRATADGRGAVFERAAETAIAWSKALDSGRGRPSLALRGRHAVFERLVYARLRETLGARCRHALSGGAPLGERLGHFYRGIGIPVLEGYGLTETTAAITLNRPDAHKVGTGGRPVPGVTVRVADDGELLVAGPQVFGGYWDDPAATAEVLEGDGWLHTGDVGEVDDEGFVRVTGRKKEILVTAGGKNVAPAVLEDRLRAHPLVSQALVVGDRRPYIAALVTLDPESLPDWAAARGKRVSGSLADDADLLAEVQRAIDEANTAVSKAEAIRRFRVLSDDWTEDGGQLTPSLKLKRNVVLREHKDDIAALYL